METKISVLVAEPSEEYRAAYARAIARETDMELVAQTDNGLRAEALVDEFQPDVVVLDLVLAYYEEPDDPELDKEFFEEGITFITDQPKRANRL